MFCYAATIEAAASNPYIVISGGCKFHGFYCKLENLAVRKWNDTSNSKNVKGKVNCKLSSIKYRSLKNCVPCTAIFCEIFVFVDHKNSSLCIQTLP